MGNKSRTPFKEEISCPHDEHMQPPTYDAAPYDDDRSYAIKCHGVVLSTQKRRRTLNNCDDHIQVRTNRRLHAGLLKHRCAHEMGITHKNFYLSLNGRILETDIYGDVDMVRWPRMRTRTAVIRMHLRLHGGMNHGGGFQGQAGPQSIATSRFHVLGIQARVRATSSEHGASTFESGHMLLISLLFNKVPLLDFN